MKIKSGFRSMKSEYIEILGIALLAVINSLAIHNTVLSIVVSIAELFLCIYYMACKPLADFVCLFLILLSTSIESMRFALGDGRAEGYSFMVLPVLNSYHLLLFLGAALCKALRKVKLAAGDKYKMLYKLCAVSCMFFLIGCIMTFVSFVLNDNQIFYHREMWSYVARDFYHTFFPVSFLLIFALLLKCDELFAERLKLLIEKILAGLIIGSVICVLCGNYYMAWDNAAYLTYTQTLFMATPFILFFYSEGKSRRRLYILVLGLLAIIIQKEYTLGSAGVWIFVTAAVLILFLIKLVKESAAGKYLLYFFSATFLLTAGVCIGTLGILENEGIHNQQVLYKFSTVLGMVSNLTDGIQGWYANLNSSIQVRVEQFVNIWMEYMDKPWFLLFGKGFGGSIIHYWGIADWNVAGSTYPVSMMKYGTYSLMHTGLAEMFLNFGLAGLLSSLWLGWISVKAFISKNSNAWIFIGVLWLYIYYTVYYSMYIGVACLFYGFYLYEGKKWDKGGCAG